MWKIFMSQFTSKYSSQLFMYYRNCISFLSSFQFQNRSFWNEWHNISGQFKSYSSIRHWIREKLNNFHTLIHLNGSFLTWMHCIHLLAFSCIARFYETTQFCIRFKWSKVTTTFFSNRLKSLANSFFDGGWYERYSVALILIMSDTWNVSNISFIFHIYYYKTRKLNTASF